MIYQLTLIDDYDVETRLLCPSSSDACVLLMSAIALGFGAEAAEVKSVPIRSTAEQERAIEVARLLNETPLELTR